MWPTLGARYHMPLYLRAHQRELISPPRVMSCQKGGHMGTCHRGMNRNPLLPFGVDFPQSGDLGVPAVAAVMQLVAEV